MELETRFAIPVFEPWPLDSDVTSTGTMARMNETTTPVIDRSIYAMPMFVNLASRDLAATEALYAAAGFVTLATIPGADGSPVLVHLRRERYQDILVTPGEPAPGSTSASFAAAGVDLDALAAALREAGAEVVGPADTPWFTRDVTFTDADGNRITLTAPRETDRPQAKAWAQEGIEGDFEIQDEWMNQGDRG